jgi:hypothetical protein
LLNAHTNRLVHNHVMTTPPVRRTRRRGCFIGCAALLLVCVAMLVPPFLEARRVQITHPVVHLAGLPPAFAGLRVALLTDIHRGPFLSAHRVRRLVELTNAQHPDLIALAGDYVHRNKKYIPSVWAELAHLHAPLGVYAVLGNHDYWESGPLSVAAIARTHITNLTNRNHRLERDGQTLYIAGVDDAWAGKPDLAAAMQGLGPDDMALVICHNPDYIEAAHDPRAKLWLAGHTHGGQVCYRAGRPLVHPSKCELRYLGGLAQCDGMQIYVSRGTGTVTPPIRWNCPPELPIIELQPL